MSITYIGGIRPKWNRRTRALPIQQVTEPAVLTLTLPQWEGERAFPVVTAGQAVLRGQLIAASDSEQIAPLHTPVSGTVESADETRIVLRNDGHMALHPACAPFERALSQLSDDELLDQIEAAGVTCSGSDVLSLAAKIRCERGRVHTLLLCAVDDEPFGGLCSHLLASEADAILDGMRILLRLYGSRHGIAAIGSDQIEALNALTAALDGQSMIELRKLKPVYPVSHPRHLVLTLFSREQKRGMTLADTGYAVFTPDTLLAVYDAFVLGLPMIERTVMIDGPCANEPTAVTVPIGMSVSELLVGCGRFKTQPSRLAEGKGILSANPIAAASAIGKGSRVILGLPEEKPLARRFRYLMNTPADAAACIGCGKCAAVCPSELDLPAILFHIAEGRREKAAAMGSEFCLGCGCCSYVCPAQIDVREELTGFAPEEPDTVDAEAGAETDGAFGGVIDTEIFEEIAEEDAASPSEEAPVPTENAPALTPESPEPDSDAEHKHLHARRTLPAAEPTRPADTPAMSSGDALPTLSVPHAADAPAQSRAIPEESHDQGDHANE